MQTTNSDFIDIMEKNHMEIPWHDYANDDSNVLIAEAGLIEKASVIGRVGLIMLSWRNRCMACTDFHEPAFQRAWCNLYGRRGIDVHCI